MKRIALLALALSLAACPSKTKTGAEGGRCFPDRSCNAGLECRNDTCVRVATDGPLPDLALDARPDAGVSVTPVGPSGGTARSGDGVAELEIPPGALGAEVAITIQVAQGLPAGSLGTAYELGPTGTAFAKPVTLRIGYDPGALGVTPEASLRLGTVVAGVWTVVPGSTVELASQRVVGELSHLSPYGPIAGAPDAGLPDVPKPSSEQRLEAGADLGGKDLAPPDLKKGDAGPLVPGVYLTVAGGSFSVGSPATELCRQPNEAQRAVTLTRAFEIGTTEVTQEDFLAVMKYNPSPNKNWLPTQTPTCVPYCGPGSPVETVTWHEAAAYCNALSALAGLTACYTCTGSKAATSCVSAFAGSTIYDCPGYRLPTEVEWERAYRAGTTTAYASGPDNGYSAALCGQCFTDPVTDVAGFYCKDGTPIPRPLGWGGTTHVNAWGIADLAGNVAEWCHDWYSDTPGGGTNPAGPATGTARVVRNGSIASLGAELRAAYRAGSAPGFYATTIGFRCVRSK